MKKIFSQIFMVISLLVILGCASKHPNPNASASPHFESIERVTVVNRAKGKQSIGLRIRGKTHYINIGQEVAGFMLIAINDSDVEILDITSKQVKRFEIVRWNKKSSNQELQP